MDALEDAIAAAPHDAARYAVYADALMRKGDARGELIALQLRLSGISDTGEFARLKEQERALLARVAADALGPLPRGCHARWRWGFVQRLSCETEDADALRALLERPVLRVLHGVRLRAGLLPVLLWARPRGLRRLEIVGGAVPAELAARVADVFAGLEHLVLQGNGLPDELLRFRGLRTLELAALEREPAFAQRLARAEWPALKRLAVEAPELPVAFVLPALGLPKLSEVVLDVSDFGPALAALAARADLRGLTDLKLLGDVTQQQLAPLFLRIRELPELKLTLPARGLNPETVLWLRQYVKLQLLGAAGTALE